MDRAPGPFFLIVPVAFWALPLHNEGDKNSDGRGGGCWLLEVFFLGAASKIGELFETNSCSVEQVITYFTRIVVFIDDLLCHILRDKASTVMGS